MLIESVLIFFSSAAMVIGTYFIWFSRYNIPNHLALGSIFVGYLVPVFLTDILSRYPSHLVTLYAYILTLGAVSYVVALFFGYKFLPLKAFFKKSPFLDAPTSFFMQYRYRFLVVISSGSLIVMALCWMYIGTVPMFSSDPFTAKFFRGEFQAAYMKVAIPYRLSQMTQITIFPILIALWYVTRKKILLLLSILMMMFFAFALTRGLVFSGLFALIALIATKKRIYISSFVIVHVLIICVGSSVYYLISLLFDLSAFSVGASAQVNMWTIIAAGAPDISDQLTLLQSFENHGTYTLGRTFFGGLVPGQYYWNPAAWSLYLANNTDDISDVASGGFRVPVAMWGYFSFGWAGVIIIPFISGIIVGASTRYIKEFISYKKILTSVLATSFYAVVLTFFSTFYLMSMYSIPTFILVVFLLYKFSIKRSNYC